MTKVLTTAEYKRIEKKDGANVLNLTLVKTVNHKLKPFGRFWIKWNVGEKGKLNPATLDVISLNISHATGMPYTPEQEKIFCKFMVKNHSDILVDEHGNLYTRISDSFVQVNHKKLSEYKQFLTELNLGDTPAVWEEYVNRYFNRTANYKNKVR